MVSGELSDKSCTGAGRQSRLRGDGGRLLGSTKVFLGPEAEAAVRRAWAAGATRDEAAAAAGITVARLVARLRDQLRDLPRRGRGVGGGRRFKTEEYDPSPEEILAGCAEARRSWTAERYGIDTLDPAEQAIRNAGPGGWNFKGPAGGRSNSVDPFTKEITCPPTSPPS